jgi:hypothetical protein
VQTGWQFPPSFNVAPTQQVPVIRAIDDHDEGSRIRWGLIPFFAKGVPPKYSTINARIETVETAASYRGPWKRGQRCLQGATGFYEWHLNAEGRKAPFYITVVDQPVFAFAGLWDRSTKADGTVVESCVQITMPPNDLMREIHNTGNIRTACPPSSSARTAKSGCSVRCQRQSASCQSFWTRSACGSARRRSGHRFGLRGTSLANGLQLRSPNNMALCISTVSAAYRTLREPRRFLRFCDAWKDRKIVPITMPKVQANGRLKT